jgi:hypothetical protein
MPGFGLSDLAALMQSLRAASQEWFRKRPILPTKLLRGLKAQQRLVSARSGLPNPIRKGQVVQFAIWVVSRRID